MPPPQPSAIPGQKYPYTIHRIYLCGHPEENIRVDKAPETSPLRVIHTIIPRPRTTDTLVFPYKQTRPRCQKCAEAHMQRPSTRHPRSFTANQCQPQDSLVEEKNGFTHVLGRLRFLGRPENEAHTVVWPDEKEGDPGHEYYRRLKKLYDSVEADRNVGPHSSVPMEQRAGARIVEGPDREGSEKLAYVLRTAVDEALAPRQEYPHGLGHERFDAEERMALRLRADFLRSMEESDRQTPAAVQQVEGGRQSRSRSNTRPGQAGQAQLSSQQVLLQPNPQAVRTPAGGSQAQAQRDHAKLRANTHDSPLSCQRVTSPPSLPPLEEQDEIARYRAIALQLLEGGGTTPGVPFAGERHSDTLPQTSRRRLTNTDGLTPENVPSEISHQRPFGPSRSSGGTTLSYGDRPRQYTRPPPGAQSDPPGVSICEILDTFNSSPLSPSFWEEEEVAIGGGRGSFGSYKSLESQRHPGPGARGRGSMGSRSSFGNQRHPGPRARDSQGSFTSFGSAENGPRPPTG